MAPIHALVEIDVSKASPKLADAGLSFTAFVVASVARAASRHPEVHAYRDFLGRVVIHRYVDVATLIETDSRDGSFPLAHLIRDADIREVADISAEIRSVKQNPSKAIEGRRLDRFAPLAGRVPGLAWGIYQLMSRSTKLRAISGTVAVSSVGMLGGGQGHGVGFPTILSLSVLVGGRTRRPVADCEDVRIGEVLDLTVTFDHNTVDGGPAARFVAELRELLMSAELLVDSRKLDPTAPRPPPPPAYPLGQHAP